MPAETIANLLVIPYPIYGRKHTFQPWGDFLSTSYFDVCPHMLCAAQPQGAPFTWTAALGQGWLAELDVCAGLGMGSGAFTHSSLGWDSAQPFGKDIWRLLSTLKPFLLDSAIPLLATGPTVTAHTGAQKYAQVYVLTEVLFAGAKVWRQTTNKCLFVGSESNKLW